MTTSTAKSIENTINQAFDDVLERHPDITDKHSKTAGIGLYVSGRKFFQISENTRNRIEFLILRDPDKDYCRPQYGDLDIRNIRKYDPTQASYIRPWGYMFYRVLVTTEQYLNNKNVFDQLIDKSYDIAKEENILKVSKTEHEQLEPIFEGTYTFEEKDEVEIPSAETSDTVVKHSESTKEEFEEAETKKSGCFIATATMGDINHPTVLHLKEFRDIFLLKRAWGVSFIRYYYHYGPYPSRIIAKSRLLRFVSYLIIIKPLTMITNWLLQNKNN